MSGYSKFFLLCTLVLVTTKVFPQAALKKFMEEYSKSPRDTNAVQLLLDIDSIYLYRMTDTRSVLDSALLMATQAKQISEALHYNRGYERAVFYIATSYRTKNDYHSADSIMKNTKAPLRVKILIMLGEAYLFRLGELTQDLDTAYIYIAQAKSISDSLGDSFLRQESLCLLGKYYFARGYIEKGRTCFKTIIDGLHKVGDATEEARWWSELGRYMPDTDSTYQDKVYCFEQSLSLYRHLQLRSREPYILMSLAFVHTIHNRFDIAEKYLLEGISIKKSLGVKKLFPYFSELSNLYIKKGSYDKALHFALSAFNNADSLGEEYIIHTICYVVAHVYEVLGETDKSIQWYHIALRKINFSESSHLFPICGRIVQGMLTKQQPKEALSFLNEFVRNHNANRLFDKEIVAASKGDCLMALGRFAEAEKKYLEMIAFDEQADSQRKKEMVSGDYRDIISGAAAYFKIGNFYAERRRYSSARHFLEKALLFQTLPASLALKRNIHLVLFKADSAEGKYYSAIKHLQIHKVLHDSIFNENKSKKIAELQIQYETAENEKKILLLNERTKIQQNELQRSALIRNFIIAVFLLLCCFFYYRYNRKQKSTQQLQAQQKEINLKNAALQHLVEEKEWLVKEIHHRVKNNFHMVIGLLGTQSAYLKNEEALFAMEDSKRRIHVMSMIHQKLYQSENLSSIIMSDYIHELVEYLKSSFETKRTIHFDVQVESIELDLSHALPLGLILNEAITNSIKYAFPNNAEGSIKISLTHKSKNKLMLNVSDDGIGLPSDFDLHKTSSMGMNLMKGLSEDIEGVFSIGNNKGTYISLVFRNDTEVAIDGIKGITTQIQLV